MTTGRLRHAHLTIQNGDPDALFRQGHGAETWFPDNANPAWPIGSARADPRLMPDQHLGLHRTMTVSYQGRSHSATHYDLSWHLNNAFWDRVFFSEPSRQQTLSRNPRHVIRPGHQLANEGREAIATNAASLLIEGAFNVHAAEPEAWTALLLAAMGEKPGESKADPLRTPFPRQTIPSGAMATETTAASGRDGTRLATAWCEAVVQRFPEFTDPADPPETARADLTRELNRRFGRRFDITSFRWLSPEEFQ